MSQMNGGGGGSSVWTAKPEGMQEICGLLRDYQQPGANQQVIFSRLQQLAALPDFNNYLALIFSSGQGVDSDTRQGAGLLMKNTLKGKYQELDQQFQGYVKNAVLSMVNNNERNLRQTAGTIAATIISMEAGFQNWQQMLSMLADGLGLAAPQQLQAGVLDTIVKVAEDCPTSLESKLEGLGKSAGEGLFPLIVNLINQTSSQQIAQTALHALNTFFTQISLQESAIDGYVMCVFKLASKGGSAEGGLRKLVCIAMVNLVSLRPDKLEEHMSQVVEYIIKNMQDEDTEVAVEASEFWTAYSEQYIESEILKPYLPTIVPILIKNMVYDEFDDMVIEAEEAEQAVKTNTQAPDLASSVKPYSSASAKHAPHSPDQNGQQIDAQKSEQETKEEGADDDDALGMGDWNLRKSSARALDFMSNIFDSDVFLQIVLPVVQQNLENSNWKLGESAILTLGAISLGCRDGLWVHLGEILQLLMRNVTDERPMIRINACWALSRYIDRVLETIVQGNPFSLQQQQFLVGEQQQKVIQETKQQANEMLEKLLGAMLSRLRDSNKIVQCRVCSQVASLLDEAQYYDTSFWQPYIKGMLQTFVDVMDTYDRRALRELYDTIGQCCLTFQDWIGSQENYNIVVPPLLQRFKRVIRIEQNQVEMEKEAAALIECMRFVVVGFKKVVEPHAQEFYDTAFNILGVQLQSRHAQMCGQYHSIPFDENLSATTIEFISCLVEEFGSTIFGQICSATGADLMALMFEFCKDNDAQIRQLAYGFLGDAAQHCLPLLQPVIWDAIQLAMRGVELAVKQMDTENSPSSDSADTNAVWSLSQMMVVVEAQQLLPHAITIMQMLVPIVQSSNSQKRNTSQNAAIALGRFAMQCPEQVAPHIQHFGGQWCARLAGVNDGLEKAHSFKGLLSAIKLNTAESSNFLPSFLTAIASWKTPYDDNLKQQMAEVLQFFKQQLTQQGSWQNLVEQSNPAVIQKLAQVYGV